MKTTLIIVASILGGLALLGLILWLVVRGVKGSVEQAGRDRLRQRYADPAQVRRVDHFAYGAGFESQGIAQVRGNGTLALTPDELWWFRAAPAQEFELPLSRIESIDFTSSHAGKALPGQRLLRVRFHTESGSSDSAAWLVQDPEAWKADIEALRAQR